MENIISFKNNANKIYAIGDIHGDIIPLIICLRDCCKVIKKKEGFDQKQNYSFDQEKADIDLDIELSKEWNNLTYKEDLNYEWIGSDSIVIICGDLLDNVRGNTFKKPGEYPMEEARLLKFINIINKEAMKNGGRIYKVLGNHDMYNLNGKTERDDSKYSSQYSKDYEGYKQGARSRLDYFSQGKPGALLIGEDNAYIFLMIKDFIFVHGGISTSLLNVANIEKTNKSLMDYIYNKQNKVFDMEIDTIENNLTFSNDSQDGIVHDRFFGFKSDKNEDEVCSILYNRFKVLCNDLKNKSNNESICNSDKMKLVIGHCNQNMYTSKSNKIFKSSFSNLSKSNKLNNFIYSEEFSSPIYTGEPSPETVIYGITIGCGDRDKDLKMDLNNPSIFRIDVGMSRGFNKGIFNPETAYSRTPQVLKIEYINNEPKLSIIKSTFNNSKIHLKDWNLDPYKMKYIKYKNKYLTVKK
jgi:hypothetical protein